MSTIRKEVMAEIVRTMAEAQQRGDDAMDAARRAFPGIPGMVLGEAYSELAMTEEEAWWTLVEKTIEGELIHRAIAAANPEGEQ